MSQPSGIVWSVTYACPLRCVHCYTESGRRRSHQLDLPEMLAVADALIAMGPDEIAIAGGEPLLVRGIEQIGRRIRDAGISTSLWTSGWNLTAERIDALAASFAVIHVSVDGATAAVHDAIRGRKGSYDRALNALAILNDAATGRDAPLLFGIDYVVTRSNLGQLEELCTRIPALYSELRFISLQAALPIGLASRLGFVEHELLTDEEVIAFAASERVAGLQALAPPTVRILANGHEGEHPYLNDQDPAITFLEVEPDGGVRGFPIYEGTVGNVRTEPGPVLWERALARRRDPFVRQAFATVRTSKDWAAAVRAMDQHFGTDEDRARFADRPVFLPFTPC
ncbi:hypothetical protein GCM10009554_19010 [Kribbella koreensis]|uniref:Radical SAM core domain-containing protein n=1 Tax=Kribbella koreensis TaxID=57909 RepID=A0ABN1PUW0_9ACTN